MCLRFSPFVQTSTLTPSTNLDARVTVTCPGACTKLPTSLPTSLPTGLPSSLPTSYTIVEILIKNQEWTLTFKLPPCKNEVPLDKAVLQLSSSKPTCSVRRKVTSPALSSPFSHIPTNWGQNAGVRPAVDSHKQILYMRTTPYP